MASGVPVEWRKKLLLVLVGLPARGKSYIAYKIVSFLRWTGSTAELFNVGKFRRDTVSAKQDAEFFDADNVEAKKLREELAFSVLHNMFDWLEHGGDVAVFDATNTTRERRKAVLSVCRAKSPSLPVIFLESICNDPTVLESNLITKAQFSPDYKNMPLETALEDLRMRIRNYEKVYEPVDENLEPDVSFIKLVNLQSKVICHHIHGRLPHLIAAFLMSVHIVPRPIWLVRAGHTKGLEASASSAGLTLALTGASTGGAAAFASPRLSLTSVSSTSSSSASPSPLATPSSLSSRLSSQLTFSSGATESSLGAAPPLPALTSPSGSPSQPIMRRSVSESHARTPSLGTPSSTSRVLAPTKTMAADLSDRGEAFGQKLSMFLSQKLDEYHANTACQRRDEQHEVDLVMFMSTLPRSLQTISPFLGTFTQSREQRAASTSASSPPSMPPSPSHSVYKPSPSLQSFPSGSATIANAINAINAINAVNSPTSSSSLSSVSASASSSSSSSSSLSSSLSSSSSSAPPSSAFAAAVAPLPFVPPLPSPSPQPSPMASVASRMPPPALPAFSALPAMQIPAVPPPISISSPALPVTVDTTLTSSSTPSTPVPTLLTSSNSNSSNSNARRVFTCDVNVESSLNMLDTGVCHGMSIADIKSGMPEEWKKWQSDPYRYRFPGGESQQDCALSLMPLVMELERTTEPVLVVSHSSTIQILYGYFLGASCPASKYSDLSIPLHTVIELIPTQYGWRESRYPLDPWVSDSNTTRKRKLFAGDVKDQQAQSIDHNTNFYK